MPDEIWSPTLGEPIRFEIRTPAEGRGPVAYLLHGRTATMADWPAPPALGGVVAVLPDAPWSERSSWYVDSRHRDGRPVETALVRDLVPAIDARYPAAADRGGRIVGGYSMGGSGALRLALAYPQIFGRALVLSPAVYADGPPPGSNARAFGAFGRGDEPFDAAVYRELNYPALLARYRPAQGPLRIFLGYGRREELLADETRRLHEALRAAPGIDVAIREYPGGHDWTVWTPGLADGLRYLAADDREGG